MKIFDKRDKIRQTPSQFIDLDAVRRSVARVEKLNDELNMLNGTGNGVHCGDGLCSKVVYKNSHSIVAFFTKDTVFPNPDDQEHAHDESEIIVVINGALEVLFNNQSSITVKEKESFIIAPKVGHRLKLLDVNTSGYFIMVTR